jgi:isopenicillin-N epimerase
MSPIPDALAAFELSADEVHLNHGSFGAVPRVVAARQAEIETEQRSNFHRYYDQVLFEGLESARVAVADWLRADRDGFVFSANASTAMTTALAALDLRPGDQVVTTSQEYPSTYANLRRLAERRRVEVVVADVDGLDDDAAAGTVLDLVGPRTGAVVVSMVTSPWSTLLPVQRLHDGLLGRRATLLVDGAHGPGLLEVDLSRLHSAFFATALHKWACFPRGTGALYVPADHRERAHPLVDAVFADAPRMSERFAWSGTSSSSGFLVAPTVLDVHRAAAEHGWTTAAEKVADELRTGFHELWPDARPVSDPRLRRMVAWSLPGVVEDELRHHLRGRGVWTWLGTVGDQTMIRVSAAWYNTVDDVDRLLGELATFRKQRRSEDARTTRA